MLVLTRKVGEEIRIGSDIILTVVEIKGNQIKLGIKAPESERILRGELVQDQMAFSQTARKRPLPH